MESEYMTCSQCTIGDIASVMVRKTILAPRHMGVEAESIWQCPSCKNIEVC